MDEESRQKAAKKTTLRECYLLEMGRQLEVDTILGSLGSPGLGEARFYGHVGNHLSNYSGYINWLLALSEFHRMLNDCEDPSSDNLSSL